MNIDKKLDIAIVGGGPAAVSLCIQLQKASVIGNMSYHLHLFEKNAVPGLGVPYALQDDSFGINLPKDLMILSSGEQHHFAQWLAQRAPHELNTFPPRHYFGQYAQERLSHLVNSRTFSLSIHCEHEVDDIELVDDQFYRLQVTHRHETHYYTVSHVILANGHMPSTAYAAFHSEANCHPNPWDLRIYKQIQTQEHVAIIGARLSAIDVALKLKNQDHQGTISMVSRLGLLSAVRGHAEIPPMRYLNAEHLQAQVPHCNSKTLLTLLIRLLEQELQAHLPVKWTIARTMAHMQKMNPIRRIDYEIQQVEAGNTAWQAVLSCFYQIVYKLWPNIARTDRRVFLEQYGSFMFTFLCSFPLDRAYQIRDMMHQRQLLIDSGLVDIKKEQPGYLIQLKHNKNFCAQRIILATGASTQPEHVPLLAKLLMRGLIEKHELGGIRIQRNNHLVCPQQAVFPSRMYALGDIVTGAYFKMIEIGQVVEQARLICQHLTC